MSWINGQSFYNGERFIVNVEPFSEICREFEISHRTDHRVVDNTAHGAEVIATNGTRCP